MRCRSGASNREFTCARLGLFPAAGIIGSRAAAPRTRCARPYAGPPHSSPPPWESHLRLFLTSGQDRGGHAQFQESHRRSRTSYEPHHGEAPARWHVVKKPSPARGAGRRESRASTTGPERKWEKPNWACWSGPPPLRGGGGGRGRGGG